MKKILLTALLALFFFSSCRAQTVFTFECFCGYLTVADGNCDVCGPTLQSRMFTGIIIRKNGVPHKWIETPYTVRFNGQVARFQELVYPNPETINIDRSQTPYGTLDSFKMAIQCPCVGGGGRDTIVIDSSGAVCAALYFFANDTAAIASPTTDQYDYYLTAPENYYGLPAGLVKLAWETTLPDSANAPGCGSGGSGTGTVTSFSFTDGGGFTGTVLNPTTTPTLSLVLQDAAADGATKGQATFTAADFNSAAGVISLDYANGQKANGSQPGFLSSTDWATFNGKLTANAPITGATKTKITYDANGLVTAGADATTSDIAEGSNLYYTDERNDDRTAALIQNNTGISWSYNDPAGTLTPTLSDNSATNELQTLTAGGSGPYTINLSGAGGGAVTLTEGTGISISRASNNLTINTTSTGDFLGTGFTSGGGSGSIPNGTVAEISDGIVSITQNSSIPSGLYFNQLKYGDGTINNYVSGGGFYLGAFGQGVGINIYGDEGRLGFMADNGSGTANEIFSSYNGGTKFRAFSGTDNLFTFDLNESEGARIVDYRATPSGIVYGGDYSGSVITNDRSIPDVGTVKIIIQSGPPQYTTTQRDSLSPSAGWTIYCTDCTATDSSTGVVQTYNGSTWKNHW